MSLCENHGEGRNGKIMSFYITVVLHGVRHSRRMRICQECIDNVRTTFGDQWSDGFILAKPNKQLSCVSCGTIAEGEAPYNPLWATGYNKAGLRHDYSALYCDECGKSVISLLRLEVGTNGNG